MFLPLLLLAAILFVENGSTADIPIGKISFVKGLVTIKKSGVEKTEVATVGYITYIGDLLQTGTESVAQMVLSDDSFVNLSSETTIRINHFSFEPGINRRTADIKILSGIARIISYKNRSNESVISVLTDNTLVKAGDPADFVISRTPSSTQVIVLKKTVQVRNTSSLVIGDVRPGINQKTVVKDNEPPSIPGTITPAERKMYSIDIRKARDGKTFQKNVATRN